MAKSCRTFWGLRGLRRAALAHSLERLLDGTPSVSLASVTKRFGEFVAVDDLDLEIGESEFFTMLGPSGCGKTTTLRMIAGFEEPTEGTVRIDGEDMVGVPSHKRPTNTV